MPNYLNEKRMKWGGGRDSQLERQMEISSSDKSKMNHHHHQQPPSVVRRKGGFRTMPFIIANEAFEKVASYGLLPNMILYLMGDYKIGIAAGTNLLFYWSAATNFLPVIGAFLSDSYLGRFLTIGIGCFFSLLGMVLFWLTTMIPQLKPRRCNQDTQTCKSATPGQYGYLISCLALMSIGAGGIRPCSLAFGADQLDHRENPKHENERALETFFSWYYVSTGVAVLVAFTVIVYIQDHIGWRIGFGIPVILMFFSTLLFFIASPLYIKVKVKKSIITSFAQVIVAAFRNRKLPYPPPNSDGYYHNYGSEDTMPTDKLRFLNKACIIRDPKDIGPDGAALDPWRLCTVEEVKELKALIRVLPIWSASVMLAINVSQGSFPTLQAKSMDKHVTKNFQIPSGSFIFFTIVSAGLWIALYDRVIIPLASKIRGKPVRLSVRLRMGIGLVISCIGMAVSALVERARHRKAVEQGLLNNPRGSVHMSALWLIPQHCLTGLAEAFNAIGQSEFYYSEFPKSMSSLASALFGLQSALASLLASVILNTVDNLTKGKGKESWISNNINKGKYQNYYWLLAAMSFINLFYYIACCWAYGPAADEVAKVTDEGKDSDEELQKLGPGVSKGENGEELPRLEVSSA